MSDTDGVLRLDEVRAAAWCATTDVAAGITEDDAAEAVEGWCRAARRAAASTGRAEADDALLRGVVRAGISAVADAYEHARRAAAIARHPSVA